MSNGGLSTLTPPADEISNIDEFQTMPMGMLRHRGSYLSDPSQQNSVISVDSIPKEERSVYPLSIVILALMGCLHMPGKLGLIMGY